MCTKAGRGNGGAGVVGIVASLKVYRFVCGRGLFVRRAYVQDATQQRCTKSSAPGFARNWYFFGGRALYLIPEQHVPPCRSSLALSTRFTFQVAFWDALKTLDDDAARRAGSLARLMAHLVVRTQLSLTILKVRG